jgi:hypothetical protein
VLAGGPRAWSPRHSDEEASMSARAGPVHIMVEPLDYGVVAGGCGHR